MANWRELAGDGEYLEGEAEMLAETDRGEGFFPINEIRASYYENWGDSIGGDEGVAKYELALTNWQMWASCSTSGGEGTARMMDVHRVEKKLKRLNV